MADFDKAIVTILKHEGGWVDNPVDPGGETNFGISMLMVRREGMTPAELGIPDFNSGSMKLMTVDTAKALYKKFFWDKYRYGLVDDQTVATKIFDCGVNCGPGRAHKMAQRVANRLGAKQLVVDGITGPNTFAAINALNPTTYLDEYCAEQLAYYQSIVARSPKLGIFLRNWTRRAGWKGP